MTEEVPPSPHGDHVGAVGAPLREHPDQRDDEGCCGPKGRCGPAAHAHRVDPGRGILRVRVGKGGKAREVPISPRMLERLRVYYAYHRNKNWLFPAAGRTWKAHCVSLAEARCM